MEQIFSDKSIEASTKIEELKQFTNPKVVLKEEKFIVRLILAQTVIVLIISAILLTVKVVFPETFSELNSYIIENISDSEND